MSATSKVLLTLLLSVAAILVYLSVFALGVTVLFWYALPATFVMLALIVWFSVASPDETEG